MEARVSPEIRAERALVSARLDELDDLIDDSIGDLQPFLEEAGRQLQAERWARKNGLGPGRAATSGDETASSTATLVGAGTAAADQKDGAG